jgi:hypothetical protein
LKYKSAQAESVLNLKALLTDYHTILTKSYKILSFSVSLYITTSNILHGSNKDLKTNAHLYFSYKWTALAKQHVIYIAKAKDYFELWGCTQPHRGG